MEKSNESFIQSLARPQPDPGGGAAAAYGASLALALLEKIVLLELGRYRKGDPEMRFWEQALVAERSLSVEMEKLRHEDVRAYANLSRALAPDRSGAERDSALGDAIRCPLEIMKKAREGLVWVSESGKHCKKHLVADLQVACEFLGACIEGAYYIAHANLNLVKDDVARSQYAAELTEDRERYGGFFAHVSRQLASRLAAKGPR